MDFLQLTAFEDTTCFHVISKPINIAIEATTVGVEQAIYYKKPPQLEEYLEKYIENIEKATYGEVMLVLKINLN